MATDKRERQRANRELRLAKKAKVDRRKKMITSIRRGAIWLIGVIIVVAIAATVF